jgi:hypothetical protein
MKKLGIYVMMLALAAVTFVGCNKDPEESPKPVITMPSSITIDYLDLDGLAIDVAVNSEDDLTAIKVYVEMDLGEKVLETITPEKKTKSWTKTYTIADFEWTPEQIKAAKEMTLKFWIEAKTEAETSSKNAPISIINADDDDPEYLSDPAVFKLQHPKVDGGFPKIDMGIEYEKNPTVTTGKFIAVTANTFVMLDKATYEAIETVEELAAAYNAGSKVSEFTSNDNAHDFTAKYLIVKDGATIRLIEMTGLSFNNGTNVASFTEKH